MRIIRGAPASGKTALVLREFKAALKTGRRDIRLIVPTATLVRHFQHELARDGCVFPPGLVASLHHFIEERTPDLAVVPEALLRAIARDCLGGTPTEGMVASVAETIRLLENAGCTPDRLAANRKLSPTAKTFARLWTDIDAKVRAAGYRTRLEQIRKAAENPARLSLWIDGFHIFSEIEAALIAALAKTCDVTMTVAIEPDDGFQPAQLSLGDEDILLTGPPRNPQKTVIEARTPEREADEIARRIVELHRNGTPLRKIAVALRDTALYLPLLRATFERFGIPARFYFSQPLASHPVATFLNGIVTGAIEGWDFASTIETLRAHPRWGRSADFDRFDFKVREAMPGRCRETLLALCESDWLRTEIAKCLDIEAWSESSSKTRHTPFDWTGRFELFAANLYRPGRIEPARDHTAASVARSHRAALASWIEAVQSIGGFWPNQDLLSLEDFWRIARPAIDTAVWQSPDNRAEVVHVMSVYEARQWDVTALFICGLVEGSFPQPREQNPFLNEADLKSLRKSPDHERDESLLFESLKTRATGFLFLTYPAHNAASKSVERSRYLDEFETAETAIPCQPLPSHHRHEPARAGRIESPALLAQLTAHHQTISLSTLEDLAQCRFKFFSHRTLQLQAPPERPSERLGPRLTGLILHQTMEHWLLDRSRDFVELFEETFDEVCRKEHIPPGYHMEVERMVAREVARKIKTNERWTPDSSEVEKDLALAFPGGVRITGRVDRIDRFDQFPGDCVIVDYKSGKKKNVERFVESPVKLQGPLYALAVREQLNLNPVAVLFWAVREDDIFGWGQVPGTKERYREMSPTWAEEARARTVERLAGFLSGAVYAHPEDRDLCRWCDYVDACRIEEQIPETLVMIEGAHGA